MRKLVILCLVASVCILQSCTKQELNDDTVLVDKDKIVRPGDQPNP